MPKLIYLSPWRSDKYLYMDSGIGIYRIVLCKEWLGYGIYCYISHNSRFGDFYFAYMRNSVDKTIYCVGSFKTLRDAINGTEHMFHLNTKELSQERFDKLKLLL